MNKHYDLIAIGAGSGGLSAAERAARYGKRCINWGQNTVVANIVNY